MTTNSINNLGDSWTTMAEFRSANPKPLLAYMISKWSLDEKYRAQLEYYGLKEIQAWQLNNMLRDFKGGVMLDGEEYTPIYQQCSRDHIRLNARHHESHMYWLSFRKSKDARVVLIQPKRNQQVKGI